MQHFHKEGFTIGKAGRTDFIQWDNVIRIQADSNYSRIFLSNGKTLFVATVLKKFEAALDQHVFIRPHKTHLVNHSFVQSFIQGANASLLLVNGECIPVSRNKRKLMRA
jgi:two-component system LytT family response regulator